MSGPQSWIFLGQPEAVFVFHHNSLDYLVKAIMRDSNDHCSRIFPDNVAERRVVVDDVGICDNKDWERILEVD